MSHYKKNTLANVIFRIDFAEKNNIAEAKLDETCRELYPVIKIEKVNEQTVTTSIDEKGIANVEKVNSSYENKKYFNRQMTRCITVSPQYVLLEVSDYDSYDNVSQTFLKVFEAICNLNHDAIISRIGMRYINQLDLTMYKKSAWKNYVKTGLTNSAYEGVLDLAAPVRIQHLVEFAIDDYRIRCITGLFNPDYPAVIRRNVVTLDFDAFINGNLEYTDASKYLDKFHSSIQTLYEGSIQERQRKLMEVVNDGE